MLLQDLKKANMIALKEKNNDARAIYSVILNKASLLDIELKAAGKEITDQDILKIIQKALKELEDERSGYEKVGNAIRVESINNQIKTIEAYLPTQLSKEDILKIIDSLEDKTLPNIMKHFKINYQGQVDMGLVSQLAKQIK